MIPDSMIPDSKFHVLQLTQKHMLRVWVSRAFENLHGNLWTGENDLKMSTIGRGKLFLKPRKYLRSFKSKLVYGSLPRRLIKLGDIEQKLIFLCDTALKNLV